MTATAARAAATSGITKRLLWIGALLVGGYFVARNVPHYLIYTEESYGPYYWPRAAYLLPHVLGGLVAIVIGPFQFWPRIRNNYRKAHRVSGRIYLLAILVGGLGGMVMAVTIPEGLAYASGLFFLSVAWFLTAGMAFIAIRRRKIEQHKEWMIRSYVVTFGFVTFRVVDDIIHYLGYAELPDHNGMLAWGCWAVPLLVTEAVLQGKHVFRSRA
jgi:uncharacterized membrane protein